jgi:hypothetical protein
LKVVGLSPCECRFSEQREKEADLHRLASALLEHETLTQSEIREVLAGTFTKLPVSRATLGEVEVLLRETAAAVGQGADAQLPSVASAESS